MTKGEPVLFPTQHGASGKAFRPFVSPFPMSKNKEDVGREKGKEGAERKEEEMEVSLASCC